MTVVMQEGVWIGTWDSGLVRYRAGRFTILFGTDGLPIKRIQTLYFDRSGRLWIGTENSLIHVEEPTSDHPRFVSYTTAEGLSSNQVNCITEDLWGRVYIGTGRGLDRLDPATGYVRHYTAADGLFKGEVHVAFRDRQGLLWFGSYSSGLSRLVPELDQLEQRPPILISGLRVAGVQQRVSELGETEISNLTLGPSQSNIQIDFVALGFAMGEALRYQYKLEGADRDWSPPTDQRTINYASLSPGTYRFLVQAVTDQGVASQSPAQITFRILPPIWLQWWFLTLVAIFIGLVIYSTHHYRVARLIELERVRTRIASDLHDDIGSNLSVIAGLSDVLRRQAERADSPTDARLSLIAAVSQRSLEAISDIVWAVNPKKDHLLDLTQRLRLFADEALFAHNIEFEFSAPHLASDRRIGAETRREVFLIFKEAVNNIVRHSGCAKAEATLQVDHKTLVLLISDDGRGFDPTLARVGEGLASMWRRAEKIDGEIEVVSKPGNGATVLLKAPLG